MPEPLIRRRDQAALAVLTAVALVSIAGWWWAKGGGRGGLVDIEYTPPLDYRFLVDVNTADWPELSQLPGVGEILARRIVEHRDANGPFDSAEDLMGVNGVGKKKLAAMRRYLAALPGDTAVANAD